MRKSKVFLVFAIIIAFCLTPFISTVKAATSYTLGIVQARESGYLYRINGIRI